MKSAVPKQVNVRKYESFDPIPPVADLIADTAALICLDEFQVRDRRTSQAVPGKKQWLTGRGKGE